MPDWLAFSIVASIVLTVVLNLVLWTFPGIARWVGRQLFEMVERRDDVPDDTPGPRIRIWFPWRLMLVASLGLTLLLNLLAWLARS